MSLAKWIPVMKNMTALLDGILAGIAAPSSIYTVQPYPQLQGSDVDRLRGDVWRVGGDFSRIIEQENVKKQNANTTKSTA